MSDASYNKLLNDLVDLQLRYNKLIRLIPEVSFNITNNYLGLLDINTSVDISGNWQTFPKYINYV